MDLDESFTRRDGAPPNAFVDLSWPV